jgi:Fe-Mn family superoxide dismutase
VTAYTLPELNYDYGALEPHISGEIMALHHGKHHAAYVTGVNTTLDKLEAAREARQFDTINLLERNLAFHLSGHVLHSIFWKNLSPDGGDTPTGELAAAIDEWFGSFDAFRAQLSSATTSVQGSGWGALSWDTLGARLYVEQVYDHQGNIGQSGVPLLVIDAWEHAYYLQYKNDRAAFVEAVWNIVDWNDVAERFTRARQFTLT